jgi:hypothetical protein
MSSHPEETLIPEAYGKRMIKNKTARNRVMPARILVIPRVFPESYSEKHRHTDRIRKGILAK